MKKIQCVKNGLVRDLIPDIIKSQDCNCEYIIIDDQNQYRTKLKHKLEEEAHEVTASHTKEEIIEEMADVLEVLDCIAKAYDIDMNEVKEIKNNKKMLKGSFKEGIYLTLYEKKV